VEGGDYRVSSIENRVVQMQFDNRQFEQGVKTTLSSLDSLNKGLKLDGATKGLGDLSNMASKFSLSGIASGVDSLVEKFRTLSIIGITALTNIVNRAATAGYQIVKSLTVDPISAGLHEYETNLNAIQTILSNTAREGTNLQQVNAALQQLNLYSDQTIYNFSEMARNIGTFTAAGVKLQTSVDAIKGIANLAAISGSSSEQASTAMYQLSQALATGTVKLMDWNSVVNAGMGGAVFQEALKETARVHGVAIDQIIKDEGSFRDSLQKGWLTSQILTETLQKFTGDLTASQLKTMGYTDQQIAGILKMGQTAKDAATKVKTMSQLINTLQEAVGSGWAQTWQIVFGDFEEAKTLFTDINNVIGGFISTSANARNKVLGDWKALGGRTVLIEAIANAFHALIAVVTPIRDAFREIFPATTAKQLYDLTVAIRDFTAKLKIGADTADKLKRTFAGVFAILGIGWDVVKAITSTLFKLFGIAASGSGSILDITAKFGDFFVALRTAIKEGHGIELFFERLGNLVAVPIKGIKALIKMLANLFGGFDPQTAAKGITGFVAKLEPITRIGDLIGIAWSKAGQVLERVWSIFQPLASKLIDFFRRFSAMITSGIDFDYNSFLNTINTGLFAGLILVIKKFFDKFKGSMPGEGFLDSIKNSFDQLTNTFSTMQNTLRAATLLQIAVAIGILTISVIALSKVDAAALARSLGAITVMFAQLLGTLALFEKMSGFSGLAKMPLVTAALILLAITIDILASAVKKLAELDWNGLAKGLTGLTVILGELVLVVKLMPPTSGLFTTAAALVILAAAVKILASSVTDLSGLSWQDMAKGLTGVGALLGALTLFTKFAEADKGGILQGAGLVLLAAGVKILASAVTDLSKLSWEGMARGLTAMAGGLAIMGAALYLIPPSSVFSAAGVLVLATSLGMISDAIAKMGGMSWGEIGRGLTTLAGALTLIVVAIDLLPPSAIFSAAGILVVAASLGMITEALQSMGKMSWTEIGKGLVALAGALTIIAIAVNVMTGAIGGAAALIIVAASLAILAPILQMFGQMSWSEMGKGLLMLAGVFVVLGAAGLLLTPVVPSLIGLGIAITLLGVGMLAAGAGLLAFSIGLTALSISGAAGAAALVAIVSAMIGLIPQVIEQIGIGLIAFANVLATAGPAIYKAIVTIMTAFLNAVQTLSPKIIDTLLLLLFLMLDALEKAIPKMARAGLNILLGVLKAIRDNIGQVAQVSLEIIARFIDGISRGLPTVIQSGVNLIINFINGIARAIDQNSTAMGQAGGNLATAIIKGMVKGLLGGVGSITSAARDVAKAALNAAKNFLGINSPSKEFEKIGMGTDEGFALGVTKFGHLVTAATEDVGANALDSMSSALSGLSDAVSGNIDMTPVVTPVLDLSLIQKNAGQISAMLSTQPLDVRASYSNAKDASFGYQQNASAQNDGTATSSNNTTTYNQYNTSPKALSSATIYRQTKNQLSAAKGALP
jgi:tape measure domain-containing protein